MTDVRQIVGHRVQPCAWWSGARKPCRRKLWRCSTGKALPGSQDKQAPCGGKFPLLPTGKEHHFGPCPGIYPPRLNRAAPNLEKSRLARAVPIGLQYTEGGAAECDGSRRTTNRRTGRRRSIQIPPPKLAGCWGADPTSGYRICGKAGSQTAERHKLCAKFAGSRTWIGARDYRSP